LLWRFRGHFAVLNLCSRGDNACYARCLGRSFREGGLRARALSHHCFGRFRAAFFAVALFHEELRVPVEVFGRLRIGRSRFLGVGVLEGSNR